MSKVTVAAVTMMGNKHKSRGVPCEDSSVAIEKNGVYCVVVADGAGSKQYTHAKLGSKSACDSISNLLCDHFDALYDENREAAVKSIVMATVHIGFSKLIEQYKLDSLERLSCTLLFCAVKDRRVLIGHIGDGLIAGVTPSGVRPITMPQNDKAGHTYFVTAPHAADYLRFIKTTVDDLHGVALMTDGVQDSVYDDNSGLVKPVVARMVETAKEGREKCEEEINSILEKYIVGASNMSDDSSFGVLLFDDTTAPDTNNLPTSATAFPRSEDTFKDLQNSMIPSVKAAKEIIANAANNKPEDAILPDGVPVKTDEDEEIKQEAPKVEEPKVETPKDEKPKEEVIINEKPAKNPILFKVIAGVEFVVIIALLIKIILGA